AEDAEDEEQPKFFCPGSLLRLELGAEPGHPLLPGLGKSLAILYHGGPVFMITTEDSSSEASGNSPGATLPGRYPGSNPLLSGWIQSPEVIERAGALAGVTVGRGRAVLFGFSPYRRAQTTGSFRLLFNAILLGSSN
ncbi:unnamed protein product, partial [marine sediment metagenome]